MNRKISDELISAYLDGELTAAEQALVEQAIREDRAASQLYEELRSVRAGLQGLPPHRLDDSFAQRVLRAAERQMLSGTDASHADAPTSAAVPKPSTVDARRLQHWQRGFWLMATVAASLLILLSFQLANSSVPFAARNSTTGPAVDRQVASAPSETPSEAPSDALSQVSSDRFRAEPVVEAPAMAASRAAQEGLRNAVTPPARATGGPTNDPNGGLLPDAKPAPDAPPQAFLAPGSSNASSPAAKTLPPGFAGEAGGGAGGGAALGGAGGAGGAGGLGGRRDPQAGFGAAAADKRAATAPGTTENQPEKSAAVAGAPAEPPELANASEEAVVDLQAGSLKIVQIQITDDPQERTRLFQILAEQAIVVDENLQQPRESADQAEREFARKGATLPFDTELIWIEAPRAQFEQAIRKLSDDALGVRIVDWTDPTQDRLTRTEVANAEPGRALARILTPSQSSPQKVPSVADGNRAKDKRRSVARSDADRDKADQPTGDGANPQGDATNADKPTRFLVILRKSAKPSDPEPSK